MEIYQNLQLEDLEGEVWVPMVCDNEIFFSMYMVSNMGRVKKTHCPFRKIDPFILKLSINNYGYPDIVISYNYQKRCYRVHRIIAQSFIPNPENKPQVNHINGVKHDNRVSNLEWCTASENTLHAHRNGLVKIPPESILKRTKKISGKNNYAARSVIDKVSGKIFYTIREAARSIPCSDSSLHRMLNGVRKNKTNLILLSKYNAIKSREK